MHINLTIRQKIWALVILALVTFSIVVSLSVIGLKRVSSGVTIITQDVLPAAQLLGNVRASYLAMHATVYEGATTKDPAQVEQIQKRVQQLYQTVIDGIVAYEKYAQSEQEKKDLNDAKQLLGSFLAKMNQVSNLASMGEADMAIGIMHTQISELHTKLAGLFESLAAQNKVRADAEGERASQTFRIILSITLIAAAIGIAFIAINGVVLGRSVTQPLFAMQKAITHTAADLDFTEPVRITSKDEIAATLTAYNQMLERLRESFANIQKSSEVMGQETQALDRNAREVAQNSRAQSDSAASMAAAIEEMTVSIAHISSRSQDAREQADHSRAIAERSAKVILATVDGIQSISGSVEKASDRIDHLRAVSNNISSVVQLIKEIADQTNLLALNAAIEAARAGEQGRGFAVVADEVRKLAERTSGATQEIGKLIENMQGSAQDAVGAMNGAVGAVSGEIENARAAGASIQDVQHTIDALISVVNEIAGSIHEQSVASTTISQQVERIAQMTEENSISEENTAHAVERMAQMSQRINAAIAQYKV